MTSKQKVNIIALRKKGLTYPQIAGETGLSVNTVKSFYRRHEASKGICKNCGAVLTQIPGHKPRVFCSDSCRLEWWREHGDQMNHNALVKRTCVKCGQTFDSYSSSKQKYCCHPCYILHRYGVP